MNCPVCRDERLVMAERSGIEIDYCPKCRGVWLDRGELDRLVERAATGGAPTPTYAARKPEHADPDDRYPRKKRKREGFLSEIFDF